MEILLRQSSVVAQSPLRQRGSVASSPGKAQDGLGELPVLATPKLLRCGILMAEERVLNEDAHSERICACMGGGAPGPFCTLGAH